MSIKATMYIVITIKAAYPPAGPAARPIGLTDACMNNNNGNSKMKSKVIFFSSRFSSRLRRRFLYGFLESPRRNIRLEDMRNRTGDITASPDSQICIVQLPSLKWELRTEYIGLSGQKISEVACLSESTKRCFIGVF